MRGSRAALPVAPSADKNSVRLAVSVRRTALVCGIAAAAIGLAVILGWAAGLEHTEGDPALDLLRGVTISLGVAAFPRDGASADDVIRAADAALYKAKRLGRDRVCVAGEEETHSAAAG